MAEKKHIPAGALWGSASITFLVAGFIMAFIAATIGSDNSKARKATNASLLFKDALFREIADGSRHSDGEDIRIMADYIKKHQDDLDSTIRTEERLRESLTKNERMMIHFANADKLPDGLLLMTNSSEWKKLREDAQDRSILIGILQKTTKPPDITLATYPDLPRTYIYLWVLIPQFCGFIIYLICWFDKYSSRYRWYELSLLGKTGLVLLMPGAGVLMIPMIVWAIGRKFSVFLKQNNKERHARREALKKGLSLDISLNAGKAFLNKLQQSRRQ